MSYARFGWDSSDVYVYLSVNGFLDCCGCLLLNGKHANTDSMIAHLREHEKAGHTVPPNVIPELERDREENDAFIQSRVKELIERDDLF